MADTLNLVNPNDSLSCKYEISKFPDGQQSLKVTTPVYNMNNEHVTIKSRFNSFQDLELIVCATQALRGIGVKEISLYIPYCLGGRSDRKFSEGGINYIKDVIAPIINSQNYTKVQIMDPHSDVLEACINNFEKVSTNKLIDFVLRDYFHNIKGVVKIDYSKLLLLSPDAGAYKKIYGVAEYMGYKGDIIVASKYRNIETGKIEKTIVPFPNNDFLDKDIFIIDDIGDGFGTFIEIAKEIKKNKRFVGKIHLVVTHSIQKNGIENALNFFERIYTTNSTNDWDIMNVSVLNIF
jgi:ribose-phosphate pyrophosphokinase